MPRGGARKGAGRKSAPKAADPLERLKARKRMYLEGLAEGKTKVQAALDAGYSESVARTAKQNIETEDVREAFAELIRSSIPAEKIAARIIDGLDATETKLYTYEGMIVDERQLIAWSERREYAKLAAEYGGYFVPTQKRELELEHAGEVNVTVEFLGAAPH